MKKKYIALLLSTTFLIGCGGSGGSSFDSSSTPSSHQPGGNPSVPNGQTGG